MVGSKKVLEKRFVQIQKGKDLTFLGAVDIIERKLHFQEDSILNAQSTITFLDKIEKAYPTKRKIHIFLDNAKYYKNKLVKNYLEGSKIQLHFLPPYSPNLNPIEKTLEVVKEKSYL